MVSSGDRMRFACEDARRSDRRPTVHIVEMPGSRHIRENEIVSHGVREERLGCDHGSDISVHDYPIGAPDHRCRSSTTWVPTGMLRRRTAEVQPMPGRFAASSPCCGAAVVGVGYGSRAEPTAASGFH